MGSERSRAVPVTERGEGGTVRGEHGVQGSRKDDGARKEKRLGMEELNRGSEQEGNVRRRGSETSEGRVGRRVGSTIHKWYLHSHSE